MFRRVFNWFRRENKIRTRYHVRREICRKASAERCKELGYDYTKSN